MMLTPIALLAALPLTASAPGDPAGEPLPWTVGEPALRSIGELAFGPEGVLFLADPLGSAVFALETGREASDAREPFLIEGPAAKIGALLGTSAAGVQINDLAVDPSNGELYLSVTRGAGEGARPVLVRIDAGGDFEEVVLEDVSFMKSALAESSEDQRAQSITDLAFVGDRLLVAGLSNEEFSSNLRSLAFPFVEGAEGAEDRTAIEIYHGNHGVYETHAPVRTMLPYEIDGQPHLVAAYTCTPLVTFDLGELEPGAKVRGRTVAELGGGNRPLDMVAYEKDGASYLLISNSRRGVMKLPTAGIESAEHIDHPVGGAYGMGYETVEELQGVQHMASAGEGMIAVMIQEPSSTFVMLGTIELP
jgi:hypothetical protein